MPYADLSIYRSKAQFCDIKGQHLAYWQAGEGEPLVLIHGFPSASWDWHSIWTTLTRHYHVTAIDLLGFGLSDKPHPHRYSIIQQADLLSAVMSSLDITRAHVLAHDYGDSVAQELLHRSLTDSSALKIQSLCLLNGGIFAKLHRPLLTQTLLKSRLGPMLVKLMGKASLERSFARIFGRDTPPKQIEIDALWELLLVNSGKRVLPAILNYLDERQCHGQRWIAGMRNASIPLCFINGTQDPISGAHMADHFGAVLPDQQLVRLDCGHYPQLEMPDKVIQHYLQFRAN